MRWRLLLAGVTLAGAAFLFARHGLYGVSILLQRGGSHWVAVAPDSPDLPLAMRLALQPEPPTARAGTFAWRVAAPGFETAELPVLAAGSEVDRMLLARIDPRRFRFALRQAPAGDKHIADWMAEPGAVMAINGAYFGPDGHPATPIIADGRRAGPRRYLATHGAFVAGPAGAGLRDLARESADAAFAGATDALVSYPLLLAEDGSHRTAPDRGWLANRSFIAEDRQGRILLGTTKAAFFTLPRLASFLRMAPLDLRLALNLDGGPVACQAIALPGASRRFCGGWEYQDGRLLAWLWGGESFALPLALIVTARPE